ncbi:MAG: glycerol-3-phosphate dehydrogenase [Chlorogloeopsis fritschii C42_A2020_084]|uniref:glycerol-3-phosphate dehydrogenase n=1 Tax=Chlorogloeopsis fritschii TaxID=1124 RepID=UPI0019F71F4F|nr:glycerol-3-phosphate dehydrogenase [Chlorogloeopsis fritschii]MBF2008135.1 glycerol-3-phosphate dehydrogenase [Chlorogloeopsis fritschii C42_A2020_084]
MNNLQAISNNAYDLVIIGGGINGAGVVRDAALRGLKTLLIEKNDFSSGSTSWSTRLIHGGLRYLETFEFSLVRESLQEREILLHIAPHLVKPLLLTIPIYRDRSRPYWKIQAGMFLYDILSFDKSLLSHRMLPKRKFQQLFPDLDAEGLCGGAQYYDCQVAYAERLCLENILSAQAAGATVLNYVQVKQLHQRGNRIDSLSCCDRFTGEEVKVKLSDRGVVVNTSGPWVDQILESITANGLTSSRSESKKIGPTKGSHIIVDPFPGAPMTALYVEAKTDGRPFFIIPWLGRYLIGTTDKHFQGNLDRIKADNDEIDYLLNETNRVIPIAGLSRQDVKFTYSGVRPLPWEEGKQPGKITRKHIICDRTPAGIMNLISLIGGKLTTYRQVAEEIVNAVYQKLGEKAPACSTQNQPLPGAILPNDSRFKKALDDYRDVIPPSSIHHLFSIYGARAIEVLALTDCSSDLAEVITPELPDIKAQIVYAVNSELARTLVDLARRRTSVAMLRNYGLDLLPVMTEVLTKHCGWSSQDCDRQVEDYYTYIQLNCIPDYQLTDLKIWDRG